MPRTCRKRLRVSPLFVRFAGQRPHAHRHKGNIYEIKGDSVEYWLHATKGWRKRSLGRLQEEMYTEEDDA